MKTTVKCTERVINKVRAILSLENKLSQASVHN